MGYIGLRDVGNGMWVTGSRKAESLKLNAGS